MTFHHDLLAATEAERNSLISIPVVTQALSGHATTEQYLAFLQEAFHHVRHTVPLLMSCGSKLPARLEWLRVLVGDYIKDEMGHQEWVLDDIAAAGGDRAKAAASEPSVPTEVMVAYAYDTITRRSPVSFFGMVLVLEGTSVALATRAADVMEQSLGLPRSAFSYLRSHGDLDIEHVAFFADLINQLDDPGDRAAVIYAARRFYRLYGDIFRDIAARHEATLPVDA
jgi:pyrroloquinoline quinone (PQQ) biosynthesis protein C